MWLTWRGQLASGTRKGATTVLQLVLSCLFFWVAICCRVALLGGGRKNLSFYVLHTLSISYLPCHSESCSLRVLITVRYFWILVQWPKLFNEGVQTGSTQLKSVLLLSFQCTTLCNFFIKNNNLSLNPRIVHSSQGTVILVVSINAFLQIREFSEYSGDSQQIGQIL